MDFNKYTILLFLLTLIAACSPQSQENQPDQPNLFLFLADDLSYFDLGITGNKYVNTPNIDAFGQSAVSFTNMHTPTAMCAPSRSTLYTGLYPHRHGCHMNHGATYDTVQSLPAYLSELGYTVALVGKKHIRPEHVYPFDYVQYDSMDHYLTGVEAPVCVIFASNEPHGPHKSGVHDPDSVMIPPKWVDKEHTRKKLAGYYTDISMLDREFGEFLQEIEKNKLGEQSITIFTSDHGYEYFAKWTCYQAGLKVPFFMKSNGLSFKNREVAALTSFTDIVPTFIELAGGKVPDNLDGKSFVPILREEKTTAHEYLYGAHTNRGIYSGKAYPIRSVSDGKWKYIRNLNHEGKFQNVLTNGWNFDSVSNFASWREWLEVLESGQDGAKWVKFYQHRPHEELYNLENDPFEKVNLAGTDSLEHIRQQLSAQLTQWMKQQNDPGMEAEMNVPLKSRDN